MVAAVAPAPDPLLTADAIVRLKKEGVADLNDVIVFGPGQHHEGERPFSDADIDDIIRNFNALSAGDNPLLGVPLGVGNFHDQAAVPAVGRVTRVWKAADGLLHAKWSDLPRRFAESINYGVFRYPSIIIDDNPPHGCPGSGCTLLAIDVVDQPAVKHLLQLPQPQWRPGSKFSERKRIRFIGRQRVMRIGKQRRCVFSEGIMDRDQMTQILLTAGWSQEDIDAITDDVVLGIIVGHEVKEAQGGGEPPPGDPSAPAPMANTPTADQMISELTTAGVDPAQLQGMSDADLLALWTQKVGGQTANAEGDPMKKKDGGTACAEQPTGAAAVAPVAPAAPAITQLQFSELRKDMAAFRQEVRTATVKQRQATAETERRLRDERVREVHKFCEEMRDSQILAPKDIDPKSTVPNEYHELMNAANSPATYTFGEKTMSAFEACKERIRNGGKKHARYFSEKLPAAGTGGMDPDLRRRMLQATPVGRTILRDDAKAAKAALPARSA
jgi:hypothetical protein